MRPRSQLLRVFAAVVALGCGCGDRDEPDAKPLSATRDLGADARSRVNSFAAVPDWNSFVELLAQRHDLARELLGPHQLSYRAAISTGPVGHDPAEPLPDVPEGRPIYERFSVIDQLELRWGSTPDQPPRLHLEQHNEHEHGRALIVIDERVWSQLDGRAWLERPLEDELWQLWADDAQAAVLDLVQLAGPHVDLGPVEAIEHEGRPALRVSLRANDRPHPERTVEAPVPWRRGAKVTLRSGSIVLDRATGLWLAAQLELSWSFEDSAGRELTGSARFDGDVQIPAQAPVISPPEQSQPVPERERPELLRERLLDGLAGP
ncbi:hypothetical protein [Enhygromyxa salina]|uniref:Lipoprotein n=1 Tax=Enhygromyxa salina TaxID=215803 RepID=A0A2S9XC18_9BACT|nr:hypothetical protein [Enhygromyxa salina]PRP90399.1 hypothetical protein ENSA7_82840 [Enhygromyxa salina]